MQGSRNLQEVTSSFTGSDIIITGNDTKPTYMSLSILLSFFGLFFITSSVDHFKYGIYKSGCGYRAIVGGAEMLTHHFKLPMSSYNCIEVLIAFFIFICQLYQHSASYRPPTSKQWHTLMPLTSSSLNEPMSKVSAAFTSPLGGISGGLS